MAYSFLKISNSAGHNSLESTDGGGGLYTHLFSGDFSPGFGEISLEGVQIWYRCAKLAALHPCHLKSSMVNVANERKDARVREEWHKALQ